ncbi:hypothetical protein M0G74_04370 [Microbulbifer sp. CAU 1566]|uniref:hypothetical protein n=1 Tax=unclassified Microbulbifer TaxID=2619833 RepID=UPI0013577412|nr:MULTISPECIES: hypothetical protein [unclassified Microbulbifer]MCK7596505.1 hypothetical protein [Microbulbifer sp. CAU 1566]
MAGSGNLRSQLHAAFIRLAALGGNVQAKLMVHHHRHGWLQVCDTEQRYPIIQNPLKLDYRRLWLSVIYTLSEADSWPSDEEKARKKLERQSRRRAEEAKARRERFRIVENKND